MKYLKTYEVLGGAAVTGQLLKQIKMNVNEWNPLMFSIINNDFKDFKKLIKTTNLEEQDNIGNTALLLASSEGKLKMLKELINKGANIFHKNNNGEDFYDTAVNRFKFINGVKDWIERKYPEFIMSKKYNL